MEYKEWDKIMRQMVLQSTMQNVVRNALKATSAGAIQSLKDFEAYREEHDPNIETAITDKDMLLWRIDIALDNRDEVAFNALVKGLEGIK